MNKNTAIQLINSLPDDVDILSLNLAVTAGGPPPEPPSKPDTRIVEIKKAASFKEISYNNEKGKPVMKTARGGWRYLVGERFEVYVDFIPGDSGYRWWRIWLGPAGHENEVLTRDYYIDKEHTNIIT